jgi:hybrid polyketide synthase/nonribosomal peptide synthetase FtdB
MSTALPLVLSYNEESAWREREIAPDRFAKRVLRVAVPLPEDATATHVERSVDALLQRHDVLRTIYSTVAGRPQRTVLPSYRYEVLEGSAPAATAPRAGGELEPRDLVQFRISDNPREQKRRQILIDLHEMVTDTWSCARFHREMGVALDAYTADTTPDFPPLASTYAEFALHQRARLQGDASGRLRDYWASQLGGAVPAAYLSPNGPDPSGDLAGEHVYIFSEQLAECLRAASSRYRATSFMVVVAALQMLLSSADGIQDIVLSTTAANRTASYTNVQGNIANTVLLRSILPPDATFAHVVGVARTTVLGGLAHQEMPFLFLQETLSRQVSGPGAGRLIGEPPIRIHYLPDAAHHFFASLDRRSPGEFWSEEADFSARPLEIGFVENPRGRVAVWVNHDALLFTKALILDLMERLWVVLRVAADDPLASAARIRAATH